MNQRRVILHTEQLCKRFHSVAAVADVSLDIAEGEIHAIIGPNGAGKTTLLNLLSGELIPTSGRLIFNGRDVTGWPPERLARTGLGRSFQHSSVFEELTTFENVRLAAQARLPSSMRFLVPADRYAGVNERAQGILADMRLDRAAGAEAGAISHGEQRQLEIAMLMAIAPTVMLLDEPTSGMGRAETSELIAVLRRLAERHTLVLVEHDMDVVFTLAHRVTVMNNGMVLATGTPEAVRADPDVRAAYLGSE